MVQLISSDRCIFEVDGNVAEMIVLLRQRMEGSAHEPLLEIKLPTVSGYALQKVLEWCRHRQVLPVEMDVAHVGKDRMSLQISEWDRSFLDGLEADDHLLTSIVLAANVLNIPELFDIGMQRVHEGLKGKHIKDVAHRFVPIEAWAVLEGTAPPSPE